jgi:adenylate kinase
MCLILALIESDMAAALSRKYEDAPERRRDKRDAECAPIESP